MSYRDFAKDYVIEYQQRPGKKRPKAVRIYVGPWYKLAAPAQKVRFTKWYYLVSIILLALSLLIRLSIDCPFTRTWYVVTPLVAAIIPAVLAAGAVWRLWTAGERFTREHDNLMASRMSGAALFLMGLTFISCIGCCSQLVVLDPGIKDILASVSCLLSFVCSVAMFAKRKGLESTLIQK